jgi:hypothetical protein
MSFGGGGGFGGGFGGSSINKPTGFAFGGTNNNTSGGKYTTLLARLWAAVARGHADDARQSSSRRGLLVETCLTRPLPQALARPRATHSARAPTPTPTPCSAVTQRARSVAEVRDCFAR